MVGSMTGVTRRTLLAASMLAFVGCSRGKPGADRPLVVAFAPTHAPTDPKALEAALASASGLRLEVRVAATADEAVSWVQSGQADAGLLPLFDYLYCVELFHVEPLLQLLRHGDRSAYESELVVLAGSEVRDVAALAGKTIGFVDRFSVTGFLLPASLLRDAGIAFQSEFLGTHDAVLAAVREGRVPAGATYQGHAEGHADLRVIAHTRAVANEPVFVQRALPTATREALVRAFVDVASKPASLGGLADATGFQPPASGVYEAALETVRAAGRSIEDLVPGGWTRANEVRRPLWSYGP